MFTQVVYKRSFVEDFENDRTILCRAWTLKSCMLVASWFTTTRTNVPRILPSACELLLFVVSIVLCHRQHGSQHLYSDISSREGIQTVLLLYTNVLDEILW